MAEETNRAALLSHIVADVRAHGLTAGDVGYRYLLRALADNGRSDVIYEMNNQTEKPGYGYQLKMGATSLTEKWDAGVGSFGSQNHFMLGQINEWFFHDLAGIQSDPAGPGFKKIIIRPAIAGDLAYVKANYESVHGLISTEWRRDGSWFTLDVSIPANTTATVFIPAQSAAAVTEGGVPAAKARYVTVLRASDGIVALAVSAGTYSFNAVMP
jgi:alpha-L-rhamnosidase